MEKFTYSKPEIIGIGQNKTGSYCMDGSSAIFGNSCSVGDGYTNENCTSPGAVADPGCNTGTKAVNTCSDGTTNGAGATVCIGGTAPDPS